MNNYIANCILEYVMDNRFIGVFDSGAGGLTVLKECQKRLPNERFLYFADSKNAPYGNSSSKRILDLTLASIKLMESLGLKALVLACNTATSVAAKHLRSICDYPIIGAEPALKPACEMFPRKNILVLATKRTLTEEKYFCLRESYKNNTSYIYEKALPELARLTEEYLIYEIVSKKEVASYLRNELAPLLEKQISAVVLGCTHYPLIGDIIKSAFPYPITLIDGAEGIANRLRSSLESMNLTRERTLSQGSEQGNQGITFFSTEPALSDKYERLFSKIAVY